MIKQTQIYGWDEEPVDERPSEFQSTGYSGLSGYHSAHDLRRTSHRRSRFGFKSLIAFCGVILALGVWALITLAPLLRR
jgi:hypothetical protein